jgi:hypothetical protein
MDLKFVRKISKSQDNRSVVIVIPRAIAFAWREYSTVDLVFNGNNLVVTPTEESRKNGVGAA